MADTKAKPLIKYYFDIVSPFGYIAYHILRNSAIFKQCDVDYIPVFLGGIMRATDNRPPLTIKNKGAYAIRSRARYIQLFSIPMDPAMPPGFPQNTLLTLRALTLIKAQHPAFYLSAIDALYAAHWSQHRPVGQADELTTLLTDVRAADGAGEKMGEAEAKRVVAEAAEQEAKSAVTRQTEEAVGSGAFGMPWFVARDADGKEEGFWGVDHMGMMADFLRLERRNDVERFKALL